jgi:hypothetical protein
MLEKRLSDMWDPWCRFNQLPSFAFGESVTEVDGRLVLGGLSLLASDCFGEELRDCRLSLKMPPIFPSIPREPLENLFHKVED